MSHGREREPGVEHGERPGEVGRQRAVDVVDGVVGGEQQPRSRVRRRGQPRQAEHAGPAVPAGAEPAVGLQVRNPADHGEPGGGAVLDGGGQLPHAQDAVDVEARDGDVEHRPPDGGLLDRRGAYGNGEQI